MKVSSSSIAIALCYLVASKVVLATESEKETLEDGIPTRLRSAVTNRDDQRQDFEEGATATGPTRSVPGSRARGSVTSRRPPPSGPSPSGPSSSGPSPSGPSPSGPSPSGPSRFGPPSSGPPRRTPPTPLSGPGGDERPTHADPKAGGTTGAKLAPTHDDYYDYQDNYYGRGDYDGDYYDDYYDYFGPAQDFDEIECMCKFGEKWPLIEGWGMQDSFGQHCYCFKEMADEMIDEDKPENQPPTDISHSDSPFKIEQGEQKKEFHETSDKSQDGEYLNLSTEQGIPRCSCSVSGKEIQGWSRQDAFGQYCHCFEPLPNPSQD